MKNVFKEYYHFTNDEYNTLWSECVFILDTNTLLNMYRYSKKTVDQYFKILEKLSDENRIWIPHQVGLEFFENRINVINDYDKSYDKVLHTLNDTKLSIDVNYKNHPYLDWDEIKSKIDKGLSSVINDVQQKKDNHPNLLENDHILEKLSKIFESKVGKGFSDEVLKNIYKEGEERYIKKIPPGYKDNKKEADKKYGDLIIWKQILEYAKENKKSIVFISGDLKEDWWLIKDGKNIMPLPQLKKEIYDYANVDFHIYTPDRFIEYYNEYNKVEKTPNLVNEVRKIREIIEIKNSEYEHGLINYDTKHIDNIESDIANIINHLMAEYSNTDELRNLLKYFYNLIELKKRLNEQVDRESIRILYHKMLIILSDIREIINKDIFKLKDLDFNISKNDLIRKINHLTHYFNTL